MPKPRNLRFYREILTAGIYMWKHIGTGRIYIGSAVDLAKRLKDYFSSFYLKRAKNYICNALVVHTHSAFSISILEYIDITNLSVEESRKLILEREQVYLNLILSEDEPNTYDILKVAGSLLGYKHSEEYIAKRSGENHPMFGKTGDDTPNFGKTLSEETKALISGSNKGIPRNKGKTVSAETKALISEAMAGENNPMFGKSLSAETLAKMSSNLCKAFSDPAVRAKMSEARKGKTYSAETKALIAKANYKKVYLYFHENPTELFMEFYSYTEAAKYLERHKKLFIEI